MLKSVNHIIRKFGNWIIQSFRVSGQVSVPASADNRGLTVVYWKINRWKTSEWMNIVTILSVNLTTVRNGIFIYFNDIIIRYVALKITCNAAVRRVRIVAEASLELGIEFLWNLEFEVWSVRTTRHHCITHYSCHTYVLYQLPEPFHTIPALAMWN